MEVGGEEVEASRGGVDLIFLVDGEVVRWRRVGALPRSVEQGEGERPGRLGRLGWLGAKGGQGAVGRRGPRGGQGSPTPSSFPFF